jgi:hypothetical protein
MISEVIGIYIMCTMFIIATAINVPLCGTKGYVTEMMKLSLKEKIYWERLLLRQHM